MLARQLKYPAPLERTRPGDVRKRAGRGRGCEGCERPATRQHHSHSQDAVPWQRSLHRSYITGGDAFGENFFESLKSGVRVQKIAVSKTSPTLMCPYVLYVFRLNTRSTLRFTRYANSAHTSSSTHTHPKRKVSHSRTSLEQRTRRRGTETESFLRSGRTV